MKKKQFLYGKVAVITGASGGIGSAIANRFLNEGARVIAADVRTGGIRNPNLAFVKTDVKDPRSVKRMISFAVSKFGTVDILINAAAVQKPIGPLAGISDKDWKNCIETNLIGTMLCCKRVLPIMIRRKRGRIINFSGGGATFPRPNYSAYAASKAGIVRFTETLAEEVRKRGISVNAVSPGSVRTAMIEEIAKAGRKKGGADFREALRIMKTGGDSPELTAGLCAYLASASPASLTGKLLSAVWDNAARPGFAAKAAGDRNIFTLRRIDGKKYIEMK